MGGLVSVIFHYVVILLVPSPCEAKKPCVHGACQDVSDADYKCECDQGWTGKKCDGNVNSKLIKALKNFKMFSPTDLYHNP